MVPLTRTEETHTELANTGGLHQGPSSSRRSVGLPDGMTHFEGGPHTSAFIPPSWEALQRGSKPHDRKITQRHLLAQ